MYDLKKSLAIITQAVGSETIDDLVLDYYGITPHKEGKSDLVFDLLSGLPKVETEDISNVLHALGDPFVNTTQKTIILWSMLRGATRPLPWVHWQLSQVFALMHRRGIAQAGLLSAFHSLMTMGIDQNLKREAMPANFVSTFMQDRAPIDALHYSGISLRGGNPQAVAVFEGSVKKLEGEAFTARKFDLAEINKTLRSFVLPELGGTEIKHAATAVGVRKTSLFESDAVAFPIPNRLAKGDHYVFREAASSVPRHGLDVVALESGMISFDFSNRGLPEFYIFDSQGSCLSDFCFGFNPFLLDPVEVSGTTAFLDDRFPSFNICHFLMDKLTRVALFEMAGYSPSNYIALLNDPYYDFFLDKVFSGARFLPVSAKRMTFRCETLLACSNSVNLSHPAHLFAPWSTNFLRERLPRDFSRDAGERIFISREKSRFRRILNLDAFNRVLKKYRIKPYVLEDMNTADRVALFNDAELVIGVYGAGNTNLLFSRPGTHFIEILPEICATSTYLWMAEAFDLDYRYVIGRDPEFTDIDHSVWTHDPQYNSRDVIVDIEALEAVLSGVLGA